MSAEHGEHHHRPVWHYLVVAAVLTVLTVIEIGPLFEWFNIPIPGLIALSVVKFAIVVALFMHLWDDAPVYSQIFTIPLLGSILMVMVLMMLFNSYRPSPQEDSFPVQERLWSNYSGECSSWLRSHRSNLMYCASPPIDEARLAMYEGGGDGGGAAAPKLDVAGLSGDDLKAELVSKGEALYGMHCVACHQKNGAGVPGAFPPLAGSDYEGYRDPVKHAGIIINGLNGEIVVNGVTYNGAMTGFGQLSDAEIAAIATYERNSWGNDDGMVTPDQVASAR